MTTIVTRYGKVALAAVVFAAGFLLATADRVAAWHGQAGYPMLSDTPLDRGTTQPTSRPASQPTTEPAKELVLDLGGKVTMKLALIPAGKFTMGSPDNEAGRDGDEGPQWEVTISRPFYMGIYEVTQAQYEAVMGKNPSRFKGADNPVENVSWDDAMEFCDKLSTKTGKTITLPTEAQWEYACRAGSKTRFGFGDKDEDLHKYGNYCDKSNTDGLDWRDKSHDDGVDKTALVGMFKPNDWGLHDMHGNVWEWCEDWYADPYKDAGGADPTGPEFGSTRVLRGGSWYDDPRICRSAHRKKFIPDLSGNNLGFRVIMDLR